MMRRLIETFKRWLENRRRRRYFDFSDSGALRIDPRWYTESPKWKEMMRQLRDRGHG